MQLRCVAIDDEPLALNVIRQYVQHFPSLKLVQTFDDAISAAEYLRRNAVDLLLIDINMPDINGIELVKSLEHRPMVIFTTAHKKFAIEGFDLDALDYLLKPIQMDRFSRAVNKAVEFFRYKNAAKKEADEFFFVRSEYQLIKIDLENIEYIESIEDYIRIHLVAGKPVMTLMTLKSLLEKLPPQRFKRIHRSYVISLAKVRSIVNRRVRLTSTELPVSDSYAGFVNEWKKNK